MKHNLKASSVFMGSMGIVVLSALSGCQGTQQEQAEPQNRFIVVEQLTSGKYVIVEETPTTGPSHAIIREKDENGTIHERVLSEEEMKQLAQQEYDKMQTGQSELNAQPQGEGMGLAGTILAAAGGALLGNMIGNALMNNANVRKHQEMSNRSAYYRSSGSTPSSTSSGTKKSFFGNNNAKSTSSSSSFGG
ncbi:MAG: hypothetical protein AB7U26_10290 [Sulfuricurvum sp.]